MTERRYFVRRQECWGGTYVYGVWDRHARKFVGGFTSHERTAEGRADRRNKAIERAHRKILNPYASPPEHA